jgi:hypothetical protein
MVDVGEASFATATSTNASSSTDSWVMASRAGARAVLGAFTVYTVYGKGIGVGCQAKASGRWFLPTTVETVVRFPRDAKR